MEESALHARLRDVVGTKSYRLLGEATGTNPETARRYMTGQSPSTEFIAAICEKFGVSGEWLLTGRGPMHLKDAKSHALQQASAGELLHSLARALEKLSDRVDRLEVFVQTLETRLWSRMASGGLGGIAGAGGSADTPAENAAHEQSQEQDQLLRRAGILEDDGGKRRGAPASGNARSRPRKADGASDVDRRGGRIADALPERPREDAR